MPVGTTEATTRRAQLERTGYRIVLGAALSTLVTAVAASLLWSATPSGHRRPGVRLASARFAATALHRHDTSAVRSGRVGHVVLAHTRTRPAPASSPRTSTRPPTRPARPATPAQVPVESSPAPLSGCGAAIASVETRGLYPQPGYRVVCPGYALGRLGMTCYNVAGACPGEELIVIALASPVVVANEFENSHLFGGGPLACDYIDCGSVAYGFQT